MNLSRDVKAILADEGPTDAGLARIAERMRPLTTEPSLTETPEEFGNAHDGGRQSRPLYTDETGLTLVRARFPSDTNTPIHNHGTWGVIAVYDGGIACRNTAASIAARVRDMRRSN